MAERLLILGPYKVTGFTILFRFVMHQQYNILLNIVCCQFKKKFIVFFLFKRHRELPTLWPIGNSVILWKLLVFYCRWDERTRKHASSIIIYSTITFASVTWFTFTSFGYKDNKYYNCIILFIAIRQRCFKFIDRELEKMYRKQFATQHWNYSLRPV